MTGLSLILYNIVLLAGGLLLSPVIIGWLLFSKKARSGFFQKLSFYPAEFLEQLAAIPRHEKKVIWFHAVSVGEFNAIRPLIDTLLQEEFSTEASGQESSMSGGLSGSYAVVISTTTKTGQRLARQTYPNLPVCYFPYDLRFCVTRALKTIAPDLMIITETELWPNFSDVANRVKKIPVLLINGRISRSSFGGYQKIRPLIGSVLKNIRHFYMQSEIDAERIQALGAPRDKVTVAGNIKFDVNPAVDPIQKNILNHLFSFDAHDMVVVLASTHSGEEGPLLDAFSTLRKDFPELKMVLAPRHPERVGEIRHTLSNKSLGFSLRSQLDESHPNREPIVVLDTIGELMTVYSLSSVAIIGGSFVSKGGHNPLEPISLRIPVVFGPHMSNFSHISQLLVEHHAGYQVQSANDTIDVVTELLTQPEIYSNIVENGQRLLERNKGAKDLLNQAIQSLISR